MNQITDTIRKANEASMQEEECFSCGERFVATWDHYREWMDQGVFVQGFFCDECQAKGRDRLL